MNIDKSWFLIVFCITIITIIIKWFIYTNIRKDIKIKGFLLYFGNTFLTITFYCNIVLQIIVGTHLFLIIYNETILDENIIKNYIIGLGDEMTETFENAKERLDKGIFFRMFEIYKNPIFLFQYYFPIIIYSNNEKDILLCLIIGFFSILKGIDFFEKSLRKFFYYIRSNEILNYKNDNINVNYNVK